MDLSDRKCYTELEKMLKENSVSITYLISSAGFAKFCSYDDISMEESLNMIDVNIGAVVALGLICIPYMEKESHIINVASQASFFPFRIRMYTAQQRLLSEITLELLMSS